MHLKGRDITSYEIQISHVKDLIYSISPAEREMFIVFTFIIIFLNPYPPERKHQQIHQQHWPFFTSEILLTSPSKAIAKQQT